MKKVIFGLAVLAIAATVAFNVNLGTKKSDKASLLAFANVEALADGEEFTITCNQYEGRCWAIDWITPTGHCYCYFSGYQYDICYFIV
ncbi:hypothetical protein SDC9_126911 [bioreactor metagenome]|uniref:Uncharacterized protein n=1 Tax=bioreactor metagenome TaxID=1076179 RepID=A0A645CSI2_9ZZZZ|nr:NVEALA domain-containing protein [Paludibacter sp.]